MENVNLLNKLLTDVQEVQKESIENFNVALSQESNPEKKKFYMSLFERAKSGDLTIEQLQKEIKNGAT